MWYIVIVIPILVCLQPLITLQHVHVVSIMMINKVLHRQNVIHYCNLCLFCYVKCSTSLLTICTRSLYLINNYISAFKLYIYYTMIMLVLFINLQLAQLWMSWWLRDDLQVSWRLSLSSKCTFGPLKPVPTLLWVLASVVSRVHDKLHDITGQILHHWGEPEQAKRLRSRCNADMCSCLYVYVYVR